MADLTREHIDDVARRVGVRGHVHAAEIDSLCTMARLALDLQEQMAGAYVEDEDDHYDHDTTLAARSDAHLYSRRARRWEAFGRKAWLQSQMHAWATTQVQGELDEARKLTDFLRHERDYERAAMKAMRDERDTARREREEVRAENERLRAEIKEYEAFEALLDEMRSAQ